jgi:hypothetical protein
MHQFLALKALPLTSSATIKCGQISWEGIFHPTPLSRTYLARLTYRQPFSPEIVVVSPELERPEGVRLPHVYPGDRLCLCYPHEWKRSHVIAQTIVPWASEWLLHYEFWAATGEWHGGGHETPPTPERLSPRY